MSREIVIQNHENTIVGFNYTTQKYYIIHEGTQTHREMLEDIKTILLNVLQIPQEDMPSDTELRNLKEEPEEVKYISYTLADNGSYISTIQLNDYKENPITLDALKKKIYVMNTNLIFDLDLNEAPQYRVQYMISYFYDNHGLNVPQTIMEKLYNILVAHYEPIAYNVIKQPKRENLTDKLYYSNSFACSNYTGKANLSYVADVNPKSKFTIHKLFSFIDNIVTVVDIPLDLVEGDKLILDTDIIKGTYTVQDIVGRRITIKETTTNSYTFPYYKAFALLNTTNIVSINRETKQITLSETPTGISATDIIEVTGTTSVTATNNETADGKYTVQSVSGKVITVQETPNISYTYTTGIQAQVFERLDLGDIKSIQNEVATLRNPISTNIPINTPIQI